MGILSKSFIYGGYILKSNLIFKKKIIYTNTIIAIKTIYRYIKKKNFIIKLYMDI